MRISPEQVIAESIDESGLSIVVTPRRAEDPRYGTIYDTVNFAGSVPVHLHPLTSTEYLLLYSRRWHTATVAESRPGYYSDHTEVIEPGWVKIQVPTGQRSLMGSDYALPVSQAETTLIDAVSRANEYLYTLTSTGSTGVVTHWWYNTTTGSVTQIAEEELPTALTRPSRVTERAWATMSDAQRSTNGEAVQFTTGLWFASPYLMVFGTDSAHRLYLARKPWGRIGTNMVERPGEGSPGMTAETAEDPRWTFWTGTGWTIETHTLQPVIDSSGNPITSLGPVSVASYRDRTLLATVIANGDNRLAQIYSQKMARSWEPQGTVPLGSVADDSYLDVLRWQQQVAPSITSDEMTDSRTEVALPYVVSTLVTETLPLPEDAPEGTTPTSYLSLNNAWGLWSIARALPVTRVAGTPLDGALSVTVTTTAAMF